MWSERRMRDRQQHPIAATTADNDESGQGPWYDLVTSVHHHYTDRFLEEFLQEIIGVYLGDCGCLAST